MNKPTGKRWRTLPCVLLVTMLGVCPPVRAADEAPRAEITAVRVGFGGKFKVGYWVPLQIDLRAGNEPVTGHVEVIVLDGDATPSLVRAPGDAEITIAAGETATIQAYAKFGQLKGPVTVEFRAESRPVAKQELRMPDAAELAGVLPSSKELIVRVGAPVETGDAPLLPGERGERLAAVSQLSQLPTAWWGYDGVDIVLITTADRALAEQFAAHAEQWAALRQWVRLGGRLVMSVGRNAPILLAADAPLAALAPGKLRPEESMLPLRQWTSIETFTETLDPLDLPSGMPAVQVPKLFDVEGKILAYAGNQARDLPLVVRTSDGFGQVTFLASDLEEAPLAAWPGRGALVEKLLGKSRSATAERDSSTLGQVTTLGFVDIAGQLRGALDQFAGVQLVPFWLIAVLVLAYIACIGPIDYFIVRRVLARPQATWVTFGATVVAFSVGAYVLADVLKGRTIRINQVDVVDCDTTTGQVRGTSWATVFSPRVKAYDVTVAQPSSGAAVPPQLVSWMGLPGVGFGGVDSTSGTLPQFFEPYRFSGSLDQMRQVPIAVWSSKAWLNQWWGDGARDVEAQLTHGAKLIGTLSSHLPATLQNAVLIHDRWAYPLRDIKPGQTIQLEFETDPQTIDTYLRHVTVQGDRSVATPYDRASFDVPRIVEIMTSFDLAGGSSYTGLTNAYQPTLDLSDAVKNGRAVLVGRLSDRAVTWQCDGQSLEEPGEHWTVLRYVFPVAVGGK